MANNSQEPPLSGQLIETPLQTYYGVKNRVIYPHILFIIAILIIIGFSILT